MIAPVNRTGLLSSTSAIRGPQRVVPKDKIAFAAAQRQEALEDDSRRNGGPVRFGAASDRK
jgi:hypothetical protein